MHLARCQWPQVHCNREFKLQKIGHSAQRCRLSGVSKQRTHIKDQRSTRRIVACSASVTAERQVAEEGDNVQLHFTVFNEGNERLESTKDAGQPLAFEVGSSAIIDNELLSAFDAGIRGLGMGAQLFSWILHFTTSLGIFVQIPMWLTFVLFKKYAIMFIEHIHNSMLFMWMRMPHIAGWANSESCDTMHFTNFAASSVSSKGPRSVGVPWLFLRTEDLRSHTSQDKNAVYIQFLADVSA